jgi:hypothetical protein
VDQSWYSRVQSYLDDLEGIARQIDQTLEQTGVETKRLDAAEVEQANSRLLEALAALESKVDQRQSLLSAADAPKLGTVLTEKLQRCGEPAGEILVARCRSVSDMISSINQRAISLFVCQFQLAQLSTDIIRLLAGQDAPATYNAPTRAEKPGDLAGGLLDEAA